MCNRIETRPFYSFFDQTQWKQTKFSLASSLFSWKFNISVSKLKFSHASYYYYCRGRCDFFLLFYVSFSFPFLFFFSCVPFTTNQLLIFPLLCPRIGPPGAEQELQLHLGVLQQHAALMIGGATATPCPICHKVVFGGEALVEHMKNTHKDPNASGVASKCQRSDRLNNRVERWCSNFEISQKKKQPHLYLQIDNVPFSNSGDDVHQV